ncbi:hypothetical protein Q7C36_015007 [Tachysurus vachellii]|uniref:Interleukin n=1 Tax=Tachysurus vachellii TaxID=175792 RepID=A0AA88MB48_TACVA|nr:hypothetical protein Q7C36_015007 [Tachysurus vachellii]
MSLHWILVLTVTLLHILTAQTVPVNGIYEDMKRSIDVLQKADCKEHDAEFYSPSGTDGCISNALKCHMLELKSVGGECFNPNSDDLKHVYRTKAYIEFILHPVSQEQANLKHCSCEKNLKTYKEFISNIWTLVQKLNSSRELKEA